jgi:hypothetical protein
MTRRLPWITCTAVTALVAATLAIEAVIRARGERGQVDSFLAPLLGMVVGFAVLGALVASRRTANRMAWVFLLAALAFAVEQLANEYANYALLVRHGRPPGGVWAAWVGDEFFIPSVAITLVFVLLLFPDGRPLSPAWGRVGRVAAAATGAALAVGAVQPGPLTDPFGAYRNPLGVQALAPLVVLAIPIVATTLACWILSLCALVLRYRRGAGRERAQIRWFAAAAVAMPISIPFAGSGLVAGEIAWAAAVIGLPVALGFAILRHRLYGIDLIIRRTLVYAVLLAMLATLYLAGVAGLGIAFRSLTGQSGTLAVTLSTLAVAAAFQPARARIQRAVDRRFARDRYDAEHALAGLAQRLRQGVELDAIRDDVLAVVETTVRPRHAHVWLRAGEETR